MIATATAIIAAQVIVPVPMQRTEDPAPMPAPEWPWRNRRYSLHCDVTDRTLRRERFLLTLADNEGLTRARITGDDQHGLNTNGFVPTELSVPPEYYAKAGEVRNVHIDGPNGTAVLVKQAFKNGALQSTSFAVRYTSKSVGIPDTEQLLGFCSSSNSAIKAGQ